MREFLKHIKDESLRLTAEKVFEEKRLTPAEGLLLYEKAPLSLLAMMSDTVRRRLNGDIVFFNCNFHIEPTNICINNCLFCSYRRKAGEPGSWEYSIDEMLETVKKFDSKHVTEVHITGGVHPSRDIIFYCELLKRIHNHRPELSIKAFSAIELDYMFSKSGLLIEEGLKMLKACGLSSIPGGGAEIFDENIRNKICPGKTSSEKWLAIHEAAHLIGIPSNATMLYGHIENYSHRIDHMERLRTLQDRTGGFNAFIPLKYKKHNNPLSFTGEVNILEDLRNYAVARIYLDNFPHLKAYWPMLGKENAQLSLSFGADDLDGTIEDTTKIYSMAGAAETNPSMSIEEITSLIRQAGYKPAERDTFYNVIRKL
ncbi:MAG: aminofutalosine synthase MqnE [Bacteroidales bacterium]